MAETPSSSALTPTDMNIASRGNVDRLLAMLPPSLFEPVITHPVGKLFDRAFAVVVLRKSWLRGEWPAETLTWPNAAAMSSLRDWMERHELLRLCRDSEEMTDELLLDVLQSFEKWDRQIHDARGKFVARLQEEFPDDEEIEELTEDELVAWLEQHSEEELEQFLNLLGFVIKTVEAMETHFAEQATTFGMNRLCTKWQERINVWSQLEEVFGPLSYQLSVGWDLAAGIFQSHGWRDLLKYRELIDRIPEIRQMIEELGRLQTSEEEDTDPTYADVFNSLRRTTEELREVEHPLARHQAQGIERSDDFIRMIPSEAMLRRRPGLKRLWHAKLAERGLLTYRVRGTYVDRVSVEIEEQQPQSKKRIRGPIIVCVDTSGSMSGRPEAVAKALTLEACRIAHAEQRRCLLYFFGSTNEFREHELSLDPDGLNKLMDFLVMGFGGGNDLDAPFREALKRLKTAEWERADILLVSDGIFPQSQVDALKPAVDDAKEKLRLRVCGLLVGKHTSEPMKSLCDPLIEVSSW